MECWSSSSWGHSWRRCRTVSVGCQAAVKLYCVQLNWLNIELERKTKNYSSLFHCEFCILFLCSSYSKGYDWGLYTIDTIMDRQDLRGNALMAMANFGDHALHHLFPTLDNGILPQLYDMLFETLFEFEAECKCYPWFEIIKGQFQQLSRTETLHLDPHERYLLKTENKWNFKITFCERFHPKWHVQSWNFICIFSYKYILEMNWNKKIRLKIENKLNQFKKIF